MQQQFGDEITIIGVAGRGEDAEIDEFIASTGVEGLTHAIDGDGEVWRSFGITSQPAWAFIDDNGDVTTMASSLGEDGLTDRVNELLDS